MKYQGLFVGLTTLDFIYLTDYYPQANQKIVAQDYLTAAGGPATNAAVSFSYFGNQGRLLTANFYPPQCVNVKDVFDFLQKMGIPHIAITQGEQPIQYLDQEEVSTIPIPSIQAIDTLGAGDIFHGAFCHYILQESFPHALTQAAHIASKSCQFFGTRSWYYSI